MAFPKRYAEIAARSRVPAGFLIGVIFLIASRPSWTSLGAGATIALLGLGLRAWAAGHLAKNEKLATSGPYAHTRNPLYLGTLIVGGGFAVAGGRLGIGILLLSFFVLWYLPVVEEEERHLRELFPGYVQYQLQVPKFWPRLIAAGVTSEPFSLALYRKNEEYQALGGFLLFMGLLAGKVLFFM